MKKLILYTLILLLMSCRSTQEVDTSVYMDAKQPVDKKSGSIACADDIGGKGWANGYGYRMG